MSNADRSLPEPRRVDPDDPVRPAALVVPAVATDPLNERGPWLDRHEIVDAISIPGAETPLYLTSEKIAITTTGIGKSDAAVTTTALLATPGVDIDSAYVLSAGIGGAPPTAGALGSVAIADAVVDWDKKHRWDRTTESEDSDRSIDLLNYRPRDYVWHLDDRLVETAVDAAETATLQTDETALEYQREYPDAPETGPTVTRGTTVTGDEFWHGPQYAGEVEWLCAQYDATLYVTTQMEDASTVLALDRFGLADRYLSVRAIANYDRSAPGEPVEESFDGTEASLALAVDNAERVGASVVDRLVAIDPLGIGPGERWSTDG